MGADGKPVRLVPEYLNAVKHRVAWFQEQRRFSPDIDAFAARIPVGALGHRGNSDFRQAEFIQNLVGRRQLARAAIDQHEVRRGPSLALVFFLVLHQAAETPGQHLAHHAVVVAGSEILTLHVELAILRFDEAFGARHDHGTHRVRAGDMAVVIDLNALGRLVQVEQFGEPGEHRCLRSGFGKTPGQGLAGIDQGMIHQLALLAALGRGHGDLVAGFQFKRFGEQAPPRELVG